MRTLPLTAIQIRLRNPLGGPIQELVSDPAISGRQSQFWASWILVVELWEQRMSMVGAAGGARKILGPICDLLIDRGLVTAMILVARASSAELLCLPNRPMARASHFGAVAREAVYRSGACRACIFVGEDSCESAVLRGFAHAAFRDLCEPRPAVESRVIEDCRQLTNPECEQADWPAQVDSARVAIVERD